MVANTQTNDGTTPVLTYESASRRSARSEHYTMDNLLSTNLESVVGNTAIRGSTYKRPTPFLKTEMSVNKEFRVEQCCIASQPCGESPARTRDSVQFISTSLEHQDIDDISNGIDGSGETIEIEVELDLSDIPEVPESLNTAKYKEVTRDDVKAQRNDKKVKRTFTVARANAKKELKKKLIKATPTGTAFFITFTGGNGQRPVECGLMYRDNSEKGQHFIVMDTVDSDIRKLVKIDATDDYPTIHKGHWNLLMRRNGGLEVRDIPRSSLDELKRYMTKGYLPSPTEISYACISLDIMSKGEGWSMSITGRDKVREIQEENAKVERLLAMTDEELLQEEKKIMAQDAEKFAAQEEMNDVRQILLQHTIDHPAPLEPAIVSGDILLKKTFIESPKKALRRFRFRPQSCVKRMALRNFHGIVRRAQRAVLAVIPCPKMATQFGCCIRGCKFEHPEGHDWKKAEKAYKASLKAPSTPVSSSGPNKVPNAPSKVKMINVDTTCVRKLDFNGTDFPALPSTLDATLAPTSSSYVNVILVPARNIVDINTTIITVDVPVVNQILRPAKALCCHPCKHMANCKRPDCKFTHIGQGCQHGNDVCSGTPCQNLARNKVKHDTKKMSKP